MKKTLFIDEEIGSRLSDHDLYNELEDFIEGNTTEFRSANGALASHLFRYLIAKSNVTKTHNCSIVLSDGTIVSIDKKGDLSEIPYDDFHMNLILNCVEYLLFYQLNANSTGDYNLKELEINYDRTN